MQSFRCVAKPWLSHVVALLVLVGAVVAGSIGIAPFRDDSNAAPAQTMGVAREAVSNPASQTPKYAPGLIAAVDPETGKLRAPTPDEIAQLRADAMRQAVEQMTSRTTDGLPPGRRLADGTLIRPLGGRFRNVAVARVRAEGGVSVQCVTSPDQLSVSGHATDEAK